MKTNRNESTFPLKFVLTYNLQYVEDQQGALTKAPFLIVPRHLCAGPAISKLGSDKTGKLYLPICYKD